MSQSDSFAGESGGTGAQPPEQLLVSYLIKDALHSSVCDACPNCGDVCAFKCKSSVVASSIKFFLVCARCAPYRLDSNSGVYTMCQVRRHNRREDCWLVAHGRVYDATRFIDRHPAGPSPIISRAGTDCTVDYDFHSLVSQRECMFVCVCLIFYF